MSDSIRYLADDGLQSPRTDNLWSHIKSCCFPLWTELQRQANVTATSAEVKQSTLADMFQSGEMKKLEYSKEELEASKRAQVLLSACGGLALSAGENFWFEHYTHMISRGKVAPLSHNSVTKRAGKIVALEIDPRIREELIKVHCVLLHVQSIVLQAVAFANLVIKTCPRLSRHHGSLH